MPSAQQVAVNTIPVNLTGVGLGRNCRIRNIDATNVVYLGGLKNGSNDAALSASNGLALAISSTIDLTDLDGDIYAMTANTTTVTVQVLRW